MLNGLMILGGLCITVIYGAKLAIGDHKQPDLDFYELYDLSKPTPVPVPEERVQLTLIQGGKANQRNLKARTRKKI